MAIAENAADNNSHTPRLQIFRGLPNADIDSLANEYPCLVLNYDGMACRGGRFATVDFYSADVSKAFVTILRTAMKAGIDLVVTGVFSRPESTLGWIVCYAMKAAYDVWICDVLSEKADGVPNCSWEEVERARHEFVPYEDEMFGAHFNRYSPISGDFRPSQKELADLIAFSKTHIHGGKMSAEYPANRRY